MLPSALSVALPGEAAVAAERPADEAKGKRDVDVGQCVVYALRLLLRASRGQDHCRARVAEDSRRLHYLLFRDSRNALHAPRPVGDRAGLHQIEADGALS